MANAVIWLVRSVPRARPAGAGGVIRVRRRFPGNVTEAGLCGKAARECPAAGYELAG
jgi:hypothetical protein